MAHNIYNDGTKDCMFVVGERSDAWHMLGQRCTNAASWQDAMKLAGLDWKVCKVSNYARNPLGQVVEVDSASIFRDSDNAHLGTVGKGFAIKQNSECFEFVDSLLEANGGSHYDSAGALGNGAKLWCAVRLPKADIEVVPGDKSETYLVFTTAHDGSIAHTAKLTSVRVVCQNTLEAALTGAGAMFKVKHTKNADARLDRAKQLMTGAIQDAKSLEIKLKALSERKLTRESMTTILDKLFPTPKEETANTTRRENVIAEVLGLYAKNDNGAFPQVAGTAYNLLNAVTEYTDHFRTARITDNREGMTLSQARAENAVLGTGSVLKNNALAVIDQVTSDGRIVSSIAPSDMDNVVSDLIRGAGL